MNAILDELQSRDAEAAKDFRALARRLARSEPTDADTIESVLRASKQSVEDLRAAVENYTRRMQWAADMKRQEQIQAERAEIHKQMQAADRKLAIAQQAHAEIILPARDRLNELSDEFRYVADAERQLLQTADPELRCEVARIEHEIRELNIVGLEEQAARADEAPKCEAQARMCGDRSRAQYWRDFAERHRRAAERARGALPAAKKRLAELKTELAAARARLLEP
jgi:hypothetical protein